MEREREKWWKESMSQMKKKANSVQKPTKPAYKSK